MLSMPLPTWFPAISMVERERLENWGKSTTHWAVLLVRCISSQVLAGFDRYFSIFEEGRLLCGARQQGSRSIRFRLLRRCCTKGGAATGEGSAPSHPATEPVCLMGFKHGPLSRCSCSCPPEIDHRDGARRFLLHWCSLLFSKLVETVQVIGALLFCVRTKWSRQ